jgi:type VI secretion system protein ImpK
MAQPDRVETEGRGPDVPVGSNATPEGRAMNRRVEVQVARTAE